MRINIIAHKLVKDGNTQDEQEDAFSASHSDGEEARTLRFAIADGATDGMLSGQWAELLTQVACSPEVPSIEISSVLSRARADWSEWLEKYLRRRERESKPVQWFEEPGLRAGGFATLLCLEAREHDAGVAWQATAAGDSCLFIVRDGKLDTAFPITRSREFNTRPSLLRSSNSLPSQSAEIAVKNGEWRGTDDVYLMSDALAKWFLTEVEAGGRPWRQLDGISRERLDELVAALRRDKQMRNDDVTLVQLKLLPSSATGKSTPPRSITAIGNVLPPVIRDPLQDKVIKRRVEQAKRRKKHKRGRNKKRRH